MRIVVHGAIRMIRIVFMSKEVISSNNDALRQNILHRLSFEDLHPNAVSFLLSLYIVLSRSGCHKSTNDDPHPLWHISFQI
jgi:hypothetical protein